MNPRRKRPEDLLQEPLPSGLIGAHAATHEAGGSDAMAVDAVAATGSLRTLGTSSTSACAGNDSRLSDSRAPNGAAGGDLTGTYPNPTIGANKVTNAQLRTSSGLSVVGRATNASGNVADISGSTDQVLRVGSGGTTLGFGTVATAGIADDAVTYAKIQNVSATDKVLGRATAGAGDAEEIACTAAARALLDDATAADQRTTLGLGSMATQAASAVAITGGSVTGLGTPSASSDAATKAYVDSIAAGLKAKQSVVAATTAAGTLASSFENGDTVDGVVLATGDRLLIKDQAAGAENGIYIVAASGAPARATDADSGTELVSAFVFVEQGTANADKAFVCTNNAITLGVTSVVFTAFASVVGALIAANNLSDLANVVTARSNLGLGTLATQSGTFSGAHSGTSSGTNTGDQTVALTGDVTGSGTGSFAATIANDAVTYAKMQNVSATSRLLGRKTAGAGDPEELDVSASADRSAVGLGNMAVVDSPVQTGRLIEVLKEQGTTNLLYVGVAAATEVNAGISADGTTFAVKRYLTTSVANDFAGLITPVFTRVGYAGDYVWVGLVGNTITQYGLWFALTSATLGNVATPTTQHVAGFRYDDSVDGTAFWRCVTCDGASGRTTTTTSVAVVASTFYTFRIVATASSVAFYINGTLVATHTTTLPGATTNLSQQQVCTTYAAAGRRTEFSRFGALIP